MTTPAILKGLRVVPKDAREWNNYFRENFSVLQSFTVATLPPASPASQMIYVTDETGGAVPAFSDGVAWRRFTDRAVVS